MKDNQNCSFTKTDYQAIRRTDTKQVLYIAKSRYRPIQNTEVFSIFDNIDGVKGTKWGVYNAVTEYLDHRSRSKEREFNSFMGSNSHIREKAFSLLTI